jgi:predicted amidohydrolase YtcJ
MTRLCQGIFVDNAMSLIPRQPMSESQMLEYFNIAMKDALEHGLTSIHDASTPPEVIKFFKGYVS